MHSGFLPLLRLAMHSAGTTEENEWGYDPKLRPLAAIVMASAAGECFVNNVIDVANTDACKPDLPTELDWHSFGLLAKLIDERADTKTKIGILVTSLTRKPADFGSGALQSFVRLTQLRNQIVHFKQSTSVPVGFGERGISFKAEHSKVIKQFEDEHLAAPERKGPNPLGMEQVISTTKIAWWACDATLRLIELFSGFGDTLFLTLTADVCRTLRTEFPEGPYFKPRTYA